MWSPARLGPMPTRAAPESSRVLQGNLIARRSAARDSLVLVVGVLYTRKYYDLHTIKGNAGALRAHYG